LTGDDTMRGSAVAEQLTGMDASLLAIETPELPLHVVGVVLLDPSGGEGYTRERLEQVITDRIPLMPPFRRRLVGVPWALDRPYWDYLADVDLSDHVFSATLPAPGDLHTLGEFVGEVTSHLIDRSRPLWELHIVDGLADGRVALVAKVHHATMYGAAGAEFLAELFDFSPEPRELAAPDDAGDAARPGSLTIARRTAWTQVRRPVTLGKFVVSSGRNAVGTVTALGRWVTRHGTDVPLPAPRVPITGSPTQRRSAAFTGLSLPLVKQVKDAGGVKVNDVVLACVALSLRDYLSARDALPDRPVVAAVPVNAGEGAASGTNLINAMVVPLPVDQPAGADLLRTVAESATASKEVTAAVGVTALAELADVTPPAALSMATWLARTLRLSASQFRIANFIVSNVMGPPIPLFMAGAQVDAVYPLGPLLLGTGMNITVLSNLDRLDVGIMACPDLVDDVWEIADALPGHLDALAKAVGVPS
jgi:diacylglycerol O-acyltransferase